MYIKAIKMKLYTLSFFIFFPVVAVLYAQTSDKQCSTYIQELLKSKEAREWQVALFNYQKSKMTWLQHHNRLNPKLNHLDSYDYEWKTKRWFEAQTKIKEDNINTDSLNLIFTVKSKILRKKITQLGHLSNCKDSVGTALFAPVSDSLRWYWRAMRKKRKQPFRIID